ncbi:MAG TPA: tetratricopeptide repeat protein [Saprospiraceae bacterium]|nr:tetratricopeptide repeat protein [Saprospiraceae bacterium]
MNDMDFIRQVSRVDILLSQSRFSQAEELLEGLMSEGYNDIEILKMMSIAKMGLHKYEDVSQLCTMIIDQNPNESFAFYLLSNVKSVNRGFQEAKDLIDKAIIIEPTNPDYHAYKASLFLQTKDYEDALNSANIGLQIDAENITSLNARSSALVGLGRRQEAFETIDKSLATDPNNPDTHANLGWGLLHHGKSDDALMHFQTALKVDPMSEYAKAGMLEAMKSKFPVYRYFLQFMLWLGKMKGKNQWIFIIGSYIALRLLGNLADNNETLKPYLVPIIALIVIFFISTWVFSPLMNLYLMTNKFGRYTLSEQQKNTSTLVGVALLISLISLVAYFAFIPNEGVLALALFSFLIMIPLGSMHIPDNVGSQKKLQLATVVIAVLMCISVMISFTTNIIFTSFTIIPVGLLVAYQWYVNYLTIRE